MGKESRCPYQYMGGSVEASSAASWDAQRASQPHGLTSWRHPPPFPTVLSGSEVQSPSWDDTHVKQWDRDGQSTAVGQDQS